MEKKQEKYHLNTYTKTRVLAYLRETCLLLKDKELPLNILVKNLDMVSDQNRKYLVEYHKKIGKPVGVIEPRTRGAYRYIKLAEEMKLILLERGFYRLTKYGEIIVTLTEGPSRNLFNLDWKETAFFLKHFLENDSIYFIPFLESIKKYKSLPELSLNFKNDLLTYLKKWFKLTMKEYLRERFLYIERWKSKKKYIENLVPPRLYWCFDLQLVSLNRNKQLNYSLSPAFHRLIQNLPLNKSPLDLNEWINKKFFFTFYVAYKSIFNELQNEIKLFVDLPFSKQKKHIIPRLERAFKENQKFPIPSKVLFSLFSETMCIKLLKDGIICEIDEIKRFLYELSSKEKKYFLYWNPEVNDGFIRKI